MLGGGAPIAKSTVTLWSASADTPKQLAQIQSGDHRRFTLSVEGPSNPGSIHYLIAKGGEPTSNKGSGDNPAIVLLSEGIIVAPSGDWWALDVEKSQIVYMPKGDPAKGQVLYRNKTGDPLKNPCKLLAPFHLAIDQQDRIWVTNIVSERVTRFPVSDPSKIETFKVSFSGSGLAVDSLGNVWIANRLGNSKRARRKLLEAMVASKISHDVFAKVLVDAWAAQTPGYESGGSVTVLRPDGGVRRAVKTRLEVTVQPASRRVNKTIGFCDRQCRSVFPDPSHHVLRDGRLADT